MNGVYNKERWVKPKNRAPKPTNYKAMQQSKRNKLRYLNTQNSMGYNSSTRNEKVSDLNSDSSKRELIKMRSTEKDELDSLNLDSEPWETIDKLSQYSMQCNFKDNKEEKIEPRRHSNSLNQSNNQIGLSKSKEEILDLSERNLVQLHYKMIDKMRLQVLKISK